MNDLFNQKISSKQRILEEIRRRGHMKTSEVIKFGIGWTNRADRDARKLAEEGYIRRMSDEKKTSFYGPYCGEEVWEYIGEDRLAA